MMHKFAVDPGVREQSQSVRSTVLRVGSPVVLKHTRHTNPRRFRWQGLEDTSVDRENGTIVVVTRSVEAVKPGLEWLSGPSKAQFADR